MTDLDRLAELGRAVEKTRVALSETVMRPVNIGSISGEVADSPNSLDYKAALDERMKSERELAEAIATLIPIANELAAQDNLATANPIFTVQQRRRDYGYDPSWGGEMVWLDEDGEEQPDGPADEYQRVQWHWVGFKDRMEFVTACLTRKGCEDYIKLNGHNLTDPRIFVEGGARNEEWRAVRAALARLTAGGEG